MKIGFDISQTGKEKAGCGFFADGLVRNLSQLEGENTFLLYPTFGDQFWDPDWETETSRINHPRAQRHSGAETFEASKRFWRRRLKHFEKEIGNPDIVHANNYYCPTQLRRARLVYSLHDLIFIKHPEWTTEENRLICFDGVFKASLFADCIIAVSEYTGRHFAETFPHYPKERLRVVREGCRFDASWKLAPPEKFKLLEREQYWLTVGTIEPRKNHRRLIEAIAAIREREGLGMPLVIAGGKGWLMDDFREEIRSKGLEDAVILTGYVEDEELQWLYQNCFAFVYPSLFEGFGLPVLEAMQCGAPIVAARTSSIPEVVGAAGILVDPLSVDSIRAALTRLLHQPELRLRLRTSGLNRAKIFTWESTARKVMRIYEETLEGPKYYSA